MLRTAALSGRDLRDPKGVDLALHPLEEPPPPPLPDGFAEPLWIQKGGGRKSAAATALDADLPRKSDDRPMLTPLVVHRGRLPHPKALGGRGSTYDMEPGIIGSIVSRPYN